MDILQGSIVDLIPSLDLYFQYCTFVTKYDRHGYKSRKRVLLLTQKTLYVVDEKDFKVKDKVPFSMLNGMYFN